MISGELKSKFEFGDVKVYRMLEEIESNLLKIYGHKLKKIILYGSYARGEQAPGSDLDVMVLRDG